MRRSSPPRGATCCARRHHGDLPGRHFAAKYLIEDAGSRRPARLRPRADPRPRHGGDILTQRGVDRRDRTTSSCACSRCASTSSRPASRWRSRACGALSRCSSSCRTSRPIYIVDAVGRRHARRHDRPTGSPRRLGAMPVKNRLRVLRAEREWSQQDLADAARGLAPERQRDRDRQVRSLAAARVPHRRPVRPADRGDFPARLKVADCASASHVAPPGRSSQAAAAQGRLAVAIC